METTPSPNLNLQHVLRDALCVERTRVPIPPPLCLPWALTPRSMPQHLMISMLPRVPPYGLPCFVTSVYGRSTSIQSASAWLDTCAFLILNFYAKYISPNILKCSPFSVATASSTKLPWVRWTPQCDLRWQYDLSDFSFTCTDSFNKRLLGTCLAVVCCTLSPNALILSQMNI